MPSTLSKHDSGTEARKARLIAASVEQSEATALEVAVCREIGGTCRDDRFGVIHTTDGDRVCACYIAAEQAQNAAGDSEHTEEFARCL